MKAKKDTEKDEEEIVYDEDLGAELVKKLRTRLKKCEREKKEYLDGWQRSKADALNARKLQTEALQGAQSRSVSDFVHNLLPTLDSFDIALQGDSWEAVDEVWRTGIEHVHSQLLKSLELSGVETFGKEGDLFDINNHEAIGHVDGGESGTIAKVERRGYRLGETVIRAAQVTVHN